MPNSSSGTPPADPTLFTPRPPEPRSFPLAAWGIAGAVVLVLLAALLLLTHRKPVATNTVFPLDPYAGSLPLSQLAMSESSSLSGGKSTFIDGHIANTGPRTVTAVTVQVFFRNDEALPPQVETLPISLIRTHEPYVDTQPVSAAPLRPGDDREFRLIFETIPTNWNTRMPEIHIVRAVTR
jgi:hypothetical protein